MNQDDLAPSVPEPPEWLSEVPEGLSDLTDRERDLLAHLTVLTMLPQMQRLKPDRGYTYERVADALGEIASDGDVKLVGDARDVWVLIRGRVIVHAARDWLRWHARMVERHDARN
jgi:hypothetical protein